MVAIATAAFVAHNLLSKVTITAGVSPSVLIFLRNVLIVTVLLVWLRSTGQQVRFPLATVFALGLLAMLNVGNAYGIVFAIGYIPVSLAILVLYLFPVLTPLFSAALGDSRLSGLQMAGALFAFGGLAVALNVWDLRIDIFGILLGVVAAVSLALNIVFSARYMRRMPRLSVLFYLMVFLFGFSAIYLLAERDQSWPHDGRTWMLVAGLMVSYSIAMCSFYIAVAILTPPRTGLIMNMEPVATIFVAALLLNETLGVWQYLGAGIVIVAVLAVSWQNARTGL